jgi:trigger factor
MQTVETLNEGLRRAYRITISRKDIDARVGAAIEQEALNSAVQQGVQQLMSEQKLRPAMQPSVELEDAGPGKDAVVKVELETLPDVPEPKTEGLKLDRLTVEPTEAEVDEALERLASGQKSYEPAPKAHAAQIGDLVVIDYEGSVDGEPFEGGKGESMRVELGSGRLIPGFEDQLVGAKANEQRTLSVTFPEDYPVAYLKGRAAKFDVTVGEVQTAKQAQLDDSFAQSMGLEGIDQLKGLLKGQIEQELNGLTRTHMKRKLLDQLAASHDFEVPPSMVEAEFAQIWQQLEHEASHEEDPKAALAEMEAEREDYRAIAERRVRLGLLLSEIGQRAGVQVSDAEMNQLIAQAAQQYRPEDRQKFVEYVRGEPMAAAQLRAPLFEDKVVDHLFSQAEITDRAVSRDVLQAEIESVDTGHVHGPGCGHDHDHDHAKPKAKKASAKKPKAAAEQAPAEEKPAKKPAAKQAKAEEPAAPAKAPRAKKADAADAPAKDAKPAKKPAAKKKASGD